ncbi:MAG TPA: cation:dicarboxylase symporter family transporter, partial [Candidatus Latescibacteria bacterium]|nr:cation:dicarboxylase symporter family transporter [Candidatus Latescibacterota bacterium]
MRRPSILEWILIGFVLGIAAGAVIGPPVAVIKPLGTVFVRLLKMLVIPLIFSTLTVGVS